MNQTVPALPQLGDACDEPHASQHESRTSTARVGEWLYTRITWNTVLVLGIAFGAATVRFWNFQLLGYSHWDEIYFVGDARTFSANWPRVWANMHWYILPVVSETDGLLFHILGVHDWIPFAISAIYGTLSSIAIYFLGSRLFGRQVGLIAGAVVATSAYSVMYSRMALADATFDFWLIVSILFIWLGFTRRQMRFYVVGGISAGIVLNTKYDGFMPLAIAAGWLALEIGVELWGARGAHRLQLGDYRIRAIGTTVLVVVALAVFAPVLAWLAIRPGLATVYSHTAVYIAYSLIKTPPTILFWFYWLFTSPPATLLALAGLAVGLIRFTRADRLLLVYTSTWAIALMLFPSYPRESLNLLPAVAIWTARGAVELWTLAGVRKALLPRPAMAGVALACGVGVLFSQMVPVAQLISLRTQGYKDAGAAVAKYQAEGAYVFTQTQAVADLYPRGQFSLEGNTTTERLLNDHSANEYIVTDHTLSWHPELVELFDLNRDRLELVNRIPNPLYPEVLLQPATEQMLRQVYDPPVIFRYILFWRVTGQLKYPTSWST